ncbi:uncharacterized protein [Argopecten irradians]|uniref:uncharacterized protein isoform X2 n=1 Tax=Argopecten irradians TaxID=31199 RepID=UPI00371A3E78
MERIEVDLMTSLKAVTFKEKPEPAFHNSHPFPFDPGLDVTSPELESRLHLDYDRMVSSVEDAIMEDQNRNRHRVTPKELLVKSNPSLYAEVSINRQSNNMLSNRRWEIDSRSKDDSNVKQMSRLEAPGPSFPFLSRTSSMNNLHNYPTGKMLRKHHSHSNQDLSGVDRRDHNKYTAALHRQHNYSMEDLRHVSESDKENRRALHFPAIRRERTKTMAPSSFPGSDPSGVNLPNVRSDLSGPLQNGSHGEFRVNHSTKDNFRMNGKPFTQKMEKWFSEIPGEGYDDSRFQENSDSSKSSSQKEKHMNGPSRSQWKVPVLKPMQNIPNKYLELRNEINANGTVNKDTNINRDQYKLRQKYLLQLKMNAAAEERERHLSKLAAEFDHDSRQYTFNTDWCPPTEQNHRYTLEDLARARKQTGDGVRKIDIGEFAIDAYNIKPNSKFTFAHLNSNGLHGTSNDQSNSESVSSNDSGVQRTPERSDPSKTTIVNLEMSRSPKSNKTRHGHLESSSNDHNGLSSLKRPGNSAVTSNTDSSYDTKHSKGYGRSKTVLSKFKTLEVFGNDTKSNKIHEYPDQGKLMGSMLTTEENGSSGSKKPTKVPVYKLDLKAITRKSVKQCPENAENTRALSDNILIPTLSLEFRTGEVVVNRKSGIGASISARNKSPKRNLAQKSSAESESVHELVDRGAGSSYNPDRMGVGSHGTSTITPDIQSSLPNTQEQTGTPIPPPVSDKTSDKVPTPEAVDEGFINGDSPMGNVNDSGKETENKETLQDENNAEAHHVDITPPTELENENSQQIPDEVNEIKNKEYEIQEEMLMESTVQLTEQMPSDQNLGETIETDSKDPDVEAIDIGEIEDKKDIIEDENAEDIITKRDAATSVSTIHKTPRQPADTPIELGETPENDLEEKQNEESVIQEEGTEQNDATVGVVPGRSQSSNV